MIFKIEISSMIPNNGDETKSDFFSRDIFKSDITFHWLQNG